MKFYANPWQQQKNGGGGGASRRAPQHDIGDRSYSQQSYTQPQVTPTQAAPSAGAEDPYAAYGGYQNYVAMWYAAMAQQQQGGQSQGDPSKPPGTS